MAFASPVSKSEAAGRTYTAFTKRSSRVHSVTAVAPIHLRSVLRRREGLLRPIQAGVKIYTRTGDAGQSSLFNGERVSKTHPILDALGHVDELNSAVGLAREYIALELSDTNQNLPEEAQSTPPLDHPFTPACSWCTFKHV